MLHEYVKIFVWLYKDIPRLDTNIMVHRLPMKNGCSPVKQKVCCMRPEMSEKIKIEVMKQFDAGFLAVTSYPQWVEIMVPVPKKDGKVCICVDYRDLNRASPKDDVPLPHIDVLVDHTAQHKVFSFATVSQVIIISRWHLKTWRKLPSSHSGALSVTRLCRSD